MDFLTKAMDWAKSNRPDSSIQHKCAFANSVQYLCTGASGGFGGPSLREHLCAWSLGTVGAIEVAGEAMTTITPGNLPMPGGWTLEDAIDHCAAVSDYRDLLIQINEREYCFDDDPADMEEVRGKSVGPAGKS
jgi:hypothetical protein